MIISVPATSANLGPGFDTLGLSLNIHNKVEIKPSRFHSVHIYGEGENNPRLKGNNMFMNIFNDHYAKLVQRRQNFKFIFNNSIPLSRGLGSSSAVIVSAIASAHEVANIKVSKRRILNYALVQEPHPDNITPAVMGGFCVASIDRQKVFYQKKDLPSYLRAVVVVPPKPISTARSRTALPRSYSKENAVFNLSHAALSVASFFSEDWEMLRLASQDRFHQRIRMKMMPELFSVQKIAYESGALLSTLSGSGSTFFSLCYDVDAQAIASRLKQKFPDFEVKTVELDNSGLTIHR